MDKLLVFQFDDSKNDLLYQEILTVIKKHGVIVENHFLNEEIIKVGDLIINPQKIEVIKNGVEIDFTYREFLGLHYLAKKPGRIFPYNYLYELIWKEKKFIGNTSSVTSLISKIRKKIESNSRNHEYILTVRDIGYRFNPKIK